MIVSAASRQRASIHRAAASVAILAALTAGLLAPAAAAASVDSRAVISPDTSILHAADRATFQAGNIISDAAFFDRGTMSESDIQLFLQSKVPSCQSGYTCLKDWYDTSRSIGADPMCGPYDGRDRERASTIIYNVAQACGINPQVILVTLQKEQGLVTHASPSASRFRIAMGQGCPDTSACDTQYYGFFNQVYGAAWQFKRYANPPGTSQYFTWYAPGKTWNIRYHPNEACGSSAVHIANQATANLYYYTPYQPNEAAVDAGYGEGDGCSSYGNRNFFNYFSDWFGATSATTAACTAPADTSVEVAAGEYFVTTDVLNGRIAPSTACADGVRSLPQGTVVTRTGIYGAWWRVRLDGAVFWVHSDYLAPTAAPPYSVARLSGGDRYATSVAVSQAAYPGTSAVVYLASGHDFPDALSAAAVAATTGSSLLLTTSTDLPSSVRAELVRLAPRTVVLVGGEGSLSPRLADAVRSAVVGVEVTRVAGGDRYETSRALALTAYRSTPVVYLATGRGFADALTASAIAGAASAPVVLVRGDGDGLDSGTMATLKELGATSAIIAGGRGSVSVGVEASLVSADIGVSRYGGANRYETSQLINAAVYTGSGGKAYLATGADFPDALSGAVLAGRTMSPLFSQPISCMTGAAKDYFIAHSTTVVTLVGGPAALSEGVAHSERC